MWTFPSLKSRFLSNSKCNSFHDAMLISEHFANLIRDSWAAKNNYIAGRHWTFLNVSQPGKANPEHPQNDPLAECYCFYVNVSQPANAFPEMSSSALTISERFAVWKQNSRTPADRPLSRTELPIFEQFEVRKLDSWASANRSPFMTAMPNAS